MDWTGIALVITAVATLVTAIRSTMNGRAIKEAKQEIKTVYVAVNHRLDLLLATTKEASFAAGREEQRTLNPPASAAEAERVARASTVAVAEIAAQVTAVQATVDAMPSSIKPKETT